MGRCLPYVRMEPFFLHWGNATRTHSQRNLQKVQILRYVRCCSSPASRDVIGCVESTRQAVLSGCHRECHALHLEDVGTLRLLRVSKIEDGV